MSKAVVVRYQTTSDTADDNQRLVEKVFAELATTDPGGLRYIVLRLSDRATFVHVAIVEADQNPLQRMPAFGDFQQGLRDRQVTPPQAMEATVVGSYRF